MQFHIGIEKALYKTCAASKGWLRERNNHILYKAYIYFCRSFKHQKGRSSAALSPSCGCAGGNGVAC